MSDFSTIKLLKSPLNVAANHPCSQGLLALHIVREVDKLALHALPKNYVVISVNRRRAMLLAKEIRCFARTILRDCRFTQMSQTDGQMCMKFESQATEFEVRLILKPDLIADLDDEFLSRTTLVWFGKNLIKSEVIEAVNRNSRLRDCEQFELNLCVGGVLPEVDQLCDEMENIKISENEEDSKTSEED